MKKDIYKNNLRQIRSRQGLSQRDLASLLSRHCEGRISLWESGRAMPSMKNIIRLAEVFKISPDEIYPDLFAELKRKYERINVNGT